VRAKTADDAGGNESRLIDLAENLTVPAIGRTATLSFALPEDKLEELLSQLRPNPVESQHVRNPVRLDPHRVCELT
jgi:hypothetical protein